MSLILCWCGYLLLLNTTAQWPYKLCWTWRIIMVMLDTPPLPSMPLQWSHMSIMASQITNNQDRFEHVVIQWETMLHCNVISHWLGAYTKWSLNNLTVFQQRVQAGNQESIKTLHYWPYVRRISTGHGSPVDSHTKGLNVMTSYIIMAQLWIVSEHPWQGLIY